MWLADHRGLRGVRAMRDKALARRNSFRMVATDLKQIRSLMRRDSSYVAALKAESTFFKLPLKQFHIQNCKTLHVY